VEYTKFAGDLDFFGFFCAAEFGVPHKSLEGRLCEERIDELVILNNYGAKFVRTIRSKCPENYYDSYQ